MNNNLQGNTKSILTKKIILLILVVASIFFNNYSVKALSCYEIEGVDGCYWGGDVPGYHICTRSEGIVSSSALVFICGNQRIWNRDVCGLSYSNLDDPYIGGCTNRRVYCINNCSCTPSSCPPSTPKNRFTTKPFVNGQQITCSSSPTNCSNSTDCNTYINTPPTCSITTNNIEMNRFDEPKAFTITVNDDDYGDTVQVTNVQVIDTAGRLRSCVNLQTSSGVPILSLGSNGYNPAVLRSGTDTPSLVSKTTTLLADARSAYGVYLPLLNGTSRCSGDLIITVSDVDSDGNGVDISESSTCSVSIGVTNSNPVVSNVELHDRSVQTPTPNLLASNSTVYVGSLSLNRRKRFCPTPVNLLTGVVGDCSSWANIPYPEGTNTNPFSLKFTVSDPDGYRDIKDLAFWMQRADNNASAETVPLVSGGVRNSIQALVGHREDLSQNASTQPLYYISMPCLGNTCSGSVLIDPFLAFTHIREKGAKLPVNGPYSGSLQTKTNYEGWLSTGFANCFNFTTWNCFTSQFIPTDSQNAATTAVNQLGNYDWMIRSDNTHYFCLSSTSNTSTVRAITQPFTCPQDCAACVVLDQLQQASSTSVDVSYLVYMNDNSNGGSAGMNQGRYEMFIGTNDKVNGIDRAHGIGSSYYWQPVLGNNGQRLSLIFDAIPPTVSTEMTTVPNVNNRFTINGTATDPYLVAGFTTRFMYSLNSQSGNTEFLSDLNNNTLNGMNDIFPLSTPTTNYNLNGDNLMIGTNAVTGSNIIGGFCVYDKAGNTCCTQTMASSINTCTNNGTFGSFLYQGPWLQTAMGSVFSNASTTLLNSQTSENSSTIASVLGESTGPAFEMVLPNIPIKLSLTSEPYNEVQSHATPLTGIFFSGSSNIGIIGGDPANKLGFNGNYRSTTESSNLNILSITSTTVLDWYDVLFSIIQKNTYSNNKLYVQFDSIKNIETSSDSMKLITITGDFVETGVLNCVGTNIVIIKGKGVLSEVKKTPKDNCLFIVAKDASLTISDSHSGLGKIDTFDASVIVSKSGVFKTTEVPNIEFVNTQIDRLVINGFVFSQNTPKFERTLINKQNEKLPAEQINYDANPIDAYRRILGDNKSMDIVCGNSEYVLCEE